MHIMNIKTYPLIPCRSIVQIKCFLQSCTQWKDHHLKHVLIRVDSVLLLRRCGFECWSDSPSPCGSISYSLLSTKPHKHGWLDVGSPWRPTAESILIKRVRRWLKESIGRNMLWTVCTLEALLGGSCLDMHTVTWDLRIVFGCMSMHRQAAECSLLI